MRDLDEAELERLQHLSVEVMAAATAWPELAPSPEEQEVMLSVPSLCDEIRHLREVERQAQRVLGAVVYYHGGGRLALNEETLLDDYVVARDRDVASMQVRFRAWPTDRRTSVNGTSITCNEVADEAHAGPGAHAVGDRPRPHGGLFLKRW